MAHADHCSALMGDRWLNLVLADFAKHRWNWSVSKDDICKKICKILPVSEMKYIFFAAYRHPQACPHMSMPARMILQRSGPVSAMHSLHPSEQTQHSTRRHMPHKHLWLLTYFLQPQRGNMRITRRKTKPPTDTPIWKLELLTTPFNSSLNVVPFPDVVPFPNMVSLKSRPARLSTPQVDQPCQLIASKPPRAKRTSKAGKINRLNRILWQWRCSGGDVWPCLHW